jgi:hypothetical protein
LVKDEIEHSPVNAGTSKTNKGKATPKIKVILISLAFIVLIFSIGFFISKDPETIGQVTKLSSQAPGLSEPKISEPVFSESAEELVDNGKLVIAGKVVLMEQVHAEYGKLPEYAKENLPIEAFADTVINKHLLLKEAEKEGIEVSDEELEGQISNQLYIAGITKEDFLDSLETEGQDYDKFMKDYRDQIAVMELIDQKVDLESAEVTEDEVIDKLEIAFSEVKDLINDDMKEAAFQKVKMQLISEKKSELVADYVNKLREAAEIEPVP